MNKTGVAMSYRAAHLDTDRPGAIIDRWLPLATVLLPHVLFPHPFGTSAQ
jgi:hypothetical protein